eukprot:TRINITY_DN2816_c0_g1_i1.p1 TRINITY_DN2816_c0_g1~~TRINITY_DN2816_c0_g1_i1.p1  ORF type:complete len:203 (+),score=6.33 TRINITY_DN2816_c0_g1_i1:54-611(+)
MSRRVSSVSQLTQFVKVGYQALKVCPNNLQYTNFYHKRGSAIFKKQQYQQFGMCNYDQLHCRRLYSEELRTETVQISEEDFHLAADQILDKLQEKMEALIDDSSIENGDVEYSQGVLTIKLGQHGTYVINKQTPNRQIWMSSPIRGPVRYDCVDGRWIYHRDGHDMVEILEQEFSQIFNEKVAFQ